MGSGGDEEVMLEVVSEGSSKIPASKSVTVGTNVLLPWGQIHER